jgi:multidrug efflux pump subunit AcrA (membrane-fusion protein)
MPVAVSLQKVKVAPMPQTVEVTRTLWGDEDSVISAKVSGRIQGIFKDVGDRLRPGDILAQLEKTDYELLLNQKELAMRESLAKLGLKDLPTGDFDAEQVPTVQRARLQSANATAKADRGRQLRAQTPPLLSEQDYADMVTVADVAKSNYEVERLMAQGALAEARARKSEIDMAQQRLLDTTVRVPSLDDDEPAPATLPSSADKPYAVTARLVSPGEYVKEGTALFRLVSDDPVKLRAITPEKYVADIKTGHKVRVIVEAYAQDFWGVVSRTNPQIDPANRTFQFEVLIPNAEHLLKPGGFAKGQVQVRVDSKAVLAPEKAIVSFAGISKVYVVRDGKAAEVVVKTSPNKRGEFVEILQGLTGTEEVVVTGLNKLAPGVSVSVAR